MIDFFKNINWKKTLHILGMLTVVIGASFFMIVESAKYYMEFYPIGSWKSIYLAALLEMFALILVVVKVKKHWFYTWGARVILFFVFISIISAAGMQAINPTLQSVASIKQESGLVELLKQEVQDLRADKVLFDKQKQKRNTAIAAAERRNAIKTLTEVMTKDAVANTGIIALLNIILLFGIRIVVQVANLFCASSIGVIYREYKKEIKEEEKPKKYKKEPEDVSYKNVMMKEFPNGKCLKMGDEFNVQIDELSFGKGGTANAAWKNAYKQKDKIKKAIDKRAQERYEKEKADKEKRDKERIEREKFEKEKSKEQKIKLKEEKKNKVKTSERQLVWIEKLKDNFSKIVKKKKSKENVDVRIK